MNDLTTQSFVTAGMLPARRLRLIPNVYHTSLVCALVLALGGVRCEAAGRTTPKADQSQIKCWTNREGIRECGNNVPPEFSQQGYEKRGASGVTVGTQNRAKSAEELQAEREQALREQEQQREREQQEARDTVLLQTYASVDDLELARDGQLQNIDTQIRIAENHMAKLQTNLAAMIEVAANQERRGEKPKPETIANIESVRSQIAGDEATIASRRKEKDAVAARFAIDIARYREIKNQAPAQNSPAPATATAQPSRSSASP